MAEEVLNEYPLEVETLALRPSSGGVFVVRANGRELFSRKQVGRFPEAGEVVKLLKGAAD